jgi:predicted lipid-binding transport protein (Tim44 family)
LIKLVSLLVSSIARLFPRAQDKYLLFAFTFLGSLVSIAELGIAKIFTDIVVGGRRATFTPLFLIIVFVVLSLIARFSHYFQRTQRVKIFSKSILATDLKNKDNSWNYSLAMEISNIASHLLQIVIVTIFIANQSLAVGMAVFLAIIVNLIVQGKLFEKQELFQRQTFQAKFRREEIPVELRVFNRVKGGEVGTLISGIVSIGLLLFLIVGHSAAIVSSSVAIISFFAVRLLATNFNSLSSSIMRFARALVNSSLSTVKDTKNSPRSEKVVEWDEA